MSLRVLIADADALLLSAYRAYLIEGIEVRTVSSGLECLAELRRWWPDVLVVDADLPWGSGLGVLELMREDPTLPMLPVLLLTSRPADLVDQTLPIGDCALLIKPIPPSVLTHVIFALADSGWRTGQTADSGSFDPLPLQTTGKKEDFDLRGL